MDGITPHVVRKKDDEIKGQKGKLRVVIDYAPGINKVTRMKYHMINRIDDIMKILMKTKIICFLM